MIGTLNCPIAPFTAVFAISDTIEDVILHEVDVEVIVSDGVAVTGKNRFGVSEGRYDIFNVKRLG